ncbi:MAG: MerR family transcriptional regulator [Fusobacteriota bacterium]
MNFDNLTECEICGKDFFKTDKKPICSRCRGAKEDEVFKIVKEFLYEYPDSSMEEVSDETDVSEDLIDAWVDEGRLERGKSLSKSCQMCGKPISRGKLCKKCKAELDDVADSLSSRKKKKKRAMYVTDEEKKS